MSLLNVPAGKELPEDIYVVIEIPANADPIKYEVDKESGALFVDRFMSTAMFYPCTSIWRLDQLACVFTAPGAQGIKFGKRGIINTINLTLYRSVPRNRAWIVAQTVQLVVLDIVISQQLGVGHPVTVALLGS
jgi:Inorganic pyrophosphatase